MFPLRKKTEILWFPINRLKSGTVSSKQQEITAPPNKSKAENNKSPPDVTFSQMISDMSSAEDDSLQHTEKEASYCINHHCGHGVPLS